MPGERLQGWLLWQGSPVFLRGHGCSLLHGPTKAAQPLWRGGTKTAGQCKCGGMRRMTFTASVFAKHLTGETWEEGREKYCYRKISQVKNKYPVNSTSASRLAL